MAAIVVSPRSQHLHRHESHGHQTNFQFGRSESSAARRSEQKLDNEQHRHGSKSGQTSNKGKRAPSYDFRGRGRSPSPQPPVKPEKKKKLRGSDDASVKKASCDKNAGRERKNKRNKLKKPSRGSDNVSAPKAKRHAFKLGSTTHKKMHIAANNRKQMKKIPKVKGLRKLDQMKKTPRASAKLYQMRKGLKKKSNCKSGVKRSPLNEQDVALSRHAAKGDGQTRKKHSLLDGLDPLKKTDDLRLRLSRLQVRNDLFCKFAGPQIQSLRSKQPQSLRSKHRSHKKRLNPNRRPRKGDAFLANRRRYTLKKKEEDQKEFVFSDYVDDDDDADDDGVDDEHWVTFGVDRDEFDLSDEDDDDDDDGDQKQD